MRLRPATPPTGTLRDDVRAFLQGEVDRGGFVPTPDSWLGGADAALSRELGRRGWLGMSFPTAYGGAEASPLERFVVTEELLAAGAPVAMHWVAERQMGPSILRWGNDEQKQRYVPPIARGETCWGIGMSEPDSGSDLASVRTRATRVDGGWQVNGTKLWTSGAHFADHLMALVRTAPLDPEKRHAGLSQLIVDLHAPGVRIRPVVSLDGGHHFNEIVMDDVFVPEGDLLGTEGEGWTQCTSELALERSGPERVLSTLPVLRAWAAALRSGELATDAHVEQVLAGLTARLVVLRTLSMSVAAELAAGRSPEVEAALVKDLGTRFEGEVVDAVRRLVPADSPLTAMLTTAVLHVPGFTLRGGTNEVLRGVVARGLGMR